MSGMWQQWGTGWAIAAGLLMSPAVGVAQTPAPAPNAAAKPVPLFDRYMLAGYAATNQRNHQTALIYFKRALDERPDDPYALQAIRNVESYLGKATAGTVETVPSPPSVTSPTGTNSPPVTRSAPVPTVVVPPLNPSAKPTQPIATQPTPAKPPTTQPTPAKPTPAKPAPAKPALTQPTPAKPATSPGSPKPTATKPTPAKPAAKPNQPTQLTPPRSLPAPQPPATAGKPPTAVVIVPAARPSEAFSEQQAIALINRWLQAKAEVFAPPYDQQQVVDLTTGELLASLMRPNGVLNWLKTNRAYFQYGVQKVDGVERFAVARERATMEINLTEERTLYLNGVIDPTRTDFSSQRVRFTFVVDNGIWKIADYKTVAGSLLERSILTPTAGIQ